jgi:hypothetical protein
VPVSTGVFSPKQCQYQLVPFHPSCARINWCLFTQAVPVSTDAFAPKLCQYQLVPFTQAVPVSTDAFAPKLCQQYQLVPFHPGYASINWCLHGCGANRTIFEFAQLLWHLNASHQLINAATAYSTQACSLTSGIVHTSLQFRLRHIAHKIKVYRGLRHIARVNL